MKLPFLNTRPANTLLYITEGKTSRVDMDKRGVLLGELEARRMGRALFAKPINNAQKMGFVPLPILLLRHLQTINPNMRSSRTR